MPALKSAPLRGTPRLHACRSSRRFANPQRCRPSARRGYASASENAKQAGEKAKSTLGSELPWMVGAAGATVAGIYGVFNMGHFGPVFKHPLPGDHYHGEGHEEDEEHGESEEKNEDGEEVSEGGDGGESGDGEGEGEASSDSDAPSSGSDDSDDSSSQQSDTSTERSTVEGDSQDGGEKSSAPAGAKELPPGPQGQNRFLVPSSKGGNMRRVESSKGIVQGRADPDAEGGSIGDVKDGSKSAVAGQTSSKQKGISNTDTKHSIDLMADPEKSKKGEGVPETAKIQGTVDPHRKQV